GPGTPVNRDSTDVPKNIPDNNPAGVTSNLVVSGPGIIQDMDVRIPGLTHTFDGDLVISLIAPDSTTVLLSSQRGGSGDNYTNTVFDDEAATAISAGTAPFTGSFRPEQALSVLDGKPAAGTWTLKVVDQASADTGTLGSWGLRETRPGC
ncbi:MAG TPA: proprotein convertase P-domain-containing protein, partial [Solirubrobacterales bacterium]|nr:proprotein convertase P-domain-containing protein [Solirubrobacterales bacterium]